MEEPNLEVYQDGEQWCWRLRYQGGIIAVSPQAFDRKDACIACFELVQHAAENAELPDTFASPLPRRRWA